MICYCSREFCICMVTVTSRNGPIRNSVLPSHLTDLANFIGLESRCFSLLLLYMYTHQFLYFSCVFCFLLHSHFVTLFLHIIIILLFLSPCILLRYYLKERAFHGTLVQDDEAEVSF